MFNSSFLLVICLSLSFLLSIQCSTGNAPQSNETASDAIATKVVTDLIDINVIMRGQAVYQQYCAVCHGKNGEGGIAQNLRDYYWIHGNRYEDLVQITTYGVVEKGMIAWEQMLTEEQISDVAIYMMTIEDGTNPEGAKASEGDLYPPSYTYYQEARDAKYAAEDAALETQIKSAVEKGKTPVLYFLADWCTECPFVTNWLKENREDLVRFEFIPLDVGLLPNLVNTYSLKKVPSFVKVDVNGKETGRSTVSCDGNCRGEDVAVTLSKL